MANHLNTILLIEDNALNQQMLTKRLEKSGFSVVHQENGLNLLEAVEAAKPDLILLDMLLPGLNGWSLARTLKADRNTASIALIAVTALVMSGDREACLEAGCDAYISKPIDFPLLLTIMQELLESASSRPEALGTTRQLSLT